MPVTKLFVEGALDVQVLYPILQGSPALQQGGSKDSLGPRARTERRENKVAAGYLRDRDFDFDPPADLSRPTVDAEDAGVPWGWRWCRHEIENYLIDPAVVSQAMDWPVPEVQQALCQAADTIRWYQAARWTIGVVRRVLPPHYQLSTRPEELNEIDLPPSVDWEAVSEWASSSIADHRGRMEFAMEPSNVRESLDRFAARFDAKFTTDAAQVLIWFSGKDLLAGMVEWLSQKGVRNRVSFRALLRDWIIANPKLALALLPEWNRLIELLRT